MRLPARPSPFARRLEAPGRLAGLTVLVTGLLAAACNREPPPGAQPEAPEAPAKQQVGAPVVPSALAPAPSAAGLPAPATSGSAAAAEPYTGPYLVVTDPSAGVYGDMSLEKKQKVGYLRSGGRVPVSLPTVVRENCPKGWYRLRDGGFVCGNVGTTNANSSDAKFTLKPPDHADVLPYMYARNAKNGTPLYKSVPTAEQMREYEPYLVKKEKEKDPESETKPAPATASNPARVEGVPLPFSKDAIAAVERALANGSGGAGVGAAPAAGIAPAGALGPALVPGVDGGADDTPWWQRDDADKRLHEVKLDELSADADDILAKRMVKGFYVAVDRQFNWNGRPWYKTTKGLVAPADRFWITKGSEFHGVELDGDKLALPMGFTYGYQKSRPKYELDSAGKLKPAGSLEYHVAVALTGQAKDVGGKHYLETRDGFWVLAAHLRVTSPSAPPADLGPTERWLDVDLSTQTVVAFDGVRPVYASLISSGKESKIEEKDHRTPTGEWRIREKHVTTTMDGDGSAAGDLPYSIEDVPYVMYFHKAFAVHGAFWHSNYGSQMSHGCVNLSPLDAKWVFDFTEPHLPEGWHGVWASEGHAGSRVVVHD